MSVGFACPASWLVSRTPGEEGEEPLQHRRVHAGPGVGDFDHAPGRRARWGAFARGAACTGAAPASWRPGWRSRPHCLPPFRPRHRPHCRRSRVSTAFALRGQSGFGRAGAGGNVQCVRGVDRRAWPGAALRMMLSSACRVRRVRSGAEPWLDGDAACDAVAGGIAPEAIQRAPDAARDVGACRKVGVEPAERAARSGRRHRRRGRCLGVAVRARRRRPAG